MSPALDAAFEAPSTLRTLECAGLYEGLPRGYLAFLPGRSSQSGIDTLSCPVLPHFSELSVPCWLAQGVAGQYVQAEVSQSRRWPLMVAAIGPPLSCVTPMLANGGHEVLAIHPLPIRFLNGILLFLRARPPTMGSYVGWTDGASVTLLGVSHLLPYVLLAPVAIGTHSIRGA